MSLPIFQTSNMTILPFNEAIKVEMSFDTVDDFCLDVCFSTTNTSSCLVFSTNK